MATRSICCTQWRARVELGSQRLLNWGSSVTRRTPFYPFTGVPLSTPSTGAAGCEAPDDQHGRLDLRLIARAPRAGWQHRRVVMRRHLGVGAVDLWLIQAGLDHGEFDVV